MTSNSQAKWSSLIGWFSVRILHYGPLPWKRSASVFVLSPGKFKLSEKQKKNQKAQFNFT